MNNEEVRSYSDLDESGRLDVLHHLIRKAKSNRKNSIKSSNALYRFENRKHKPVDRYNMLLNTHVRNTSLYDENIKDIQKLAKML